MEHTQLTPALQQQIVAWIRAGGYPHVAAEARGISRRTYTRWLRLGRGKNARAPFAGFAVEVHSAAAQARLRAEAAVLEQDPRIWLEHGPGRESPGNPGWSMPVKAVEAAGQEQNPFLNVRFMTLGNLILQILEPYPEARASVAAAMTAMGRGAKHRNHPEEPVTAVSVNGSPTP
jgi:hypothetical protein